SHLYVDPQRPEFTCTASGYSDAGASVDFALVDVAGQELMRERVPLVSPDASGFGQSRTLVGTAVWKPALPDVGYYRVRSALGGEQGQSEKAEISLALVPEQEAPRKGEFGWTFGRGKGSLTLAEVAEVAQNGGVNWLKTPVWDVASEPGQDDKFIVFVDSLERSNIRLVGMLTDPPAAVRKK